MNKLTYTMENYLEAIYELGKQGEGARVSDIAERLGVSKASTNSAMSTLSEKGLITNERYKLVYLTPTGREIAEFTARKHHLIYQFLTTVLQVDAETADEDACLIEHVISNTSVTAMQNFLTERVTE
ncbi:MAG: Mn-dependent transcriptional regulator [Herbinix sp.]|jgi:Mn-dependent DtxR family transcriptional regulator|nr:Mn-dependent transcriptional regulator [Herbinix sp.]